MRFDTAGTDAPWGEKTWYDDRTQIVSDTDLFVERARQSFPDLPLFMIGHSMGGFGAATLDRVFIRQAGRLRAVRRLDARP